MESQIQGTVLGVSGRTSRNGQHQMYDVQMSDGQKYTTFDPELAGQANGLQGQNVVANVSVEQNGKYLNRNLLSIGLPGTLPAPTPQAPGLPVGTAIPVAGAPAVNPAAGIPMAPPSSGGGMSDEDKARISRFSAASTAFEFVGSLFTGAGPEAGAQATSIARSLTEAIVAYGVQGYWPGSVPASPAGLATTIPGVQQGVEGIAQPAAPPVEPSAAVAVQGTDIPWDAPAAEEAPAVA